MIFIHLSTLLMTEISDKEKNAVKLQSTSHSKNVFLHITDIQIVSGASYCMARSY